MTSRLDVSIGPVQGFVVQSRRTRDLWGSSYLLAFLSAHAMRGAEDGGGTITQPDVADDRLYRWVSGNHVGKGPRLGSLPNHFAVNVHGDVRAVAEAAVTRLHKAWQCVCDAVWKQYVEPDSPAGNRTKAIWQRQVHTFWDVTWTASPATEDQNLLGRRKHWRSHHPPDEEGDKCTVMHDYQELSGHVRARNLREQNEFWDRIRRRLSMLDLRENERLCAIALVKRLFPKVAPQALGWPVDTSNWRSTVYVGAIPWLKRVEEAVPDQAREYAAQVQQIGRDAFPMQRGLIQSLQGGAAGDFAKLDGNYLHREFVANKSLCPLDGDTSSADRKRLSDLLRNIYGATDSKGARLGPPPVFYALLLADGDRLGELGRELGGATVSRALAAFTEDAPRIVELSGGATVYAGGDDLLAMLPVARALQCADTVSESYRAAFQKLAGQSRATLSAALVFAHVRLPLRSVLNEARHLLDSVAKEGNGRNSLAASVLKPSGRHCQWATTWARAPENSARAVTHIAGLVGNLESHASTPGISSALVYRIRELLTVLCGWDRWQPGDWRDVPDDLHLRPFLDAEISHSVDDGADQQGSAHARDLTDRVYTMLKRSHANASITGIGIDALLLARFLADRDQQESHE